MNTVSETAFANDDRIELSGVESGISIVAALANCGATSNMEAIRT